VGSKDEKVISNDLIHPQKPDFKNHFTRNEKTEVHEKLFKLARMKAGKTNPNWVFETKDVESAEDRIEELENKVKDSGKGKTDEVGGTEPDEVLPSPVQKPKTTKKRGRKQSQVV